MYCSENIYFFRRPRNNVWVLCIAGLVWNNVWGLCTGIAGLPAPKHLKKRDAGTIFNEKKETLKNDFQSK